MKIFKVVDHAYIQGMGQTAMQLIFSDRYFHALDVSNTKDFSEWERVERNRFRTSSLKLAAMHRAYADHTCETVFYRAFNDLTPIPRIPESLVEFLDPHQIDGVRWILSRRRSYLAHAPGAGKTAQAIVASCLLRGPGTTVFIVPPGLERNWEREIFKFSERYMPFPRVGVIGRTIDQRSVSWKGDFIIIPDSMLTKPWVYERIQKLRIKLLAVDEASRLKEPTSKRTIAFFGGRAKAGPISVKTYTGIFQSAQRVVFLDGSPMPNRPMELWAPTYALDPEAIDCMSQQDFGFRYCGAKQNDRGQWEFKHSSHEAELKEKLQKRFMHVVTEDKLDHPERRRSLLFMNQDVRTPEMKKWEKRELSKFFKNDEVSEELSQGEVAHYRRELGLRKIPWSLRYIQERMDGKNEKLLIFAWHREVCEEIFKALKKDHPNGVALVIGGTPNEYREAAFRHFQDGPLRVIVGNIQAMGRGHNLQRADRVVFVEPSWSDESNKQCEKRASRRGRAKESFVRCEYIVAPDSMDERVMTTLFSKATRVKRVIG